MLLIITASEEGTNLKEFCRSILIIEKRMVEDSLLNDI